MYLNIELFGSPKSFGRKSFSDMESFHSLELNTILSVRTMQREKNTSRNHSRAWESTLKIVSTKLTVYSICTHLLDLNKVTELSIGFNGVKSGCYLFDRFSRDYGCVGDLVS